MQIKQVSNDKKDCFLRIPTKPVCFPISEKDRNICEALLKAIIDHPGYGVAANQLGYGISAIVVLLEDNQMNRSIRKAEDLVQFFSGIMLNPIYKPMSDEKTEDWEACMSVPDVVGLVPRFKEILCEYFDLDGVHHRMEARGWLARVIQHEVDHLMGIAFIDIISPEKTMPMEDYVSMRKKKLEQAS
jgi:peptide deformylase